MPLRIINMTNSFVQFDTTEALTDCEFPNMTFCLPVYEDDDVYFQFVIETDTIDEANDLCTLTNSDVDFGLVRTCGASPLITFTDTPERFRISDFQVLFNWSNGLPGFSTVMQLGECFHILLTVNAQTFCSNCFQRISNPCHTSVIEYGNDDNAFGFNYCNSEGSSSSSSDTDCEPMFVTFTNQTTLAIPYTAEMLAKYGNIPTIKLWIYDTDGQLKNMSATQALDAYPPTVLNFDFGGLASGVIKIS